MKKSTDITIILDRSGSMSYIKETTIKGFNSFLKEQQATCSDTKITLVQFDYEYQVIYESINILEAKELSNKTFEPRGATALLDAIGLTIDNTKNRIKLSNKDEKPNNVIIVIITDGEENSSNKFSREMIFKKISKREKKDNWNFIFLGSNQDAIAVGGSFGIKSGKALTFANDSDGAVDAFKSMPKVVHNSLSEEVLEMYFSNDDRYRQER